MQLGVGEKVGFQLKPPGDLGSSPALSSLPAGGTGAAQVEPGAREEHSSPTQLSLCLAVTQTLNRARILNILLQFHRVKEPAEMETIAAFTRMRVVKQKAAQSLAQSWVVPPIILILTYPGLSFLAWAAAVPPHTTPREEKEFRPRTVQCLAPGPQGQGVPV